jgi:hypothetical protein
MRTAKNLSFVSMVATEIDVEQGVWKRRKPYRLIWAVWMLVPALIWAQAVNRISGIITDQSGGVIVSATVVATNLATNVSTSTQSNESGYYVLQLPAGVYEVKASQPGFRTTVREKVQVTVGADVSSDFVLNVETKEQSVDVVGEATPLLTPNSAEVQTTVENDLVSNLPLAVSGGLRNSADFLRVTPGYQGSSFSARINGGVGLDQEVTIDGATVSPVAFGSGIQGSQNTVPAFAVQEFQMVGSNIEAQYGRTSTAVIKYVYKSGTNDFHGSVFEYLRNEALDARNTFAPTVAKDRQNEFGADVSGPVVLPHFYDGHDKTFFYGYYNGYRLRNSNPAAIYSLLTPEMRQGDFTAPGLPNIYDPATTRSDGHGGFIRDQFSCNGRLNVICPDRIDGSSAYFAGLFPDPNRPGLANNFQGTDHSTSSVDQFLVKVDQVIRGGRLNVSYNHTRQPTTSQGPFGDVLSGTFGINQGRRVILNLDQNLSTHIINHFGGSFNRWAFFNHQGAQDSLESGSNLNAKAGLGGILNQTGQATIHPGVYYLGIGGNVNKIAHQNWRLTDDVSWIKGAHEFQFGVNQTRYYTTGLQQAGGFTPFGTFYFGPLESGLPGDSSTGFAVASYLLGDVNQATYGQQPSQAWLFRYWGLYAQDKWKIRPNLTLTYGLRWEYESPILEKLDRLANFDPGLANPGAGGHLGALVFAGTGEGRSGQRQFADAWHNGFGPRIGIAYELRKNTVLRGAYGMMYDTNSGPAIFLNQQGYFAQSTVSTTNGGITPAFNWSIGYPPVPLGPFFDPTFANGGSTSYMQLNGARLPQIQNWNVGVQQMLPGNFVLDVSYVGTSAHHMLVGTLNANQMDPRYLSLGPLLGASIDSPDAIAAGIPLPYPGFSGSVAQALRPYPQYQGITLSSNPNGNNTYNAFQVRAQKRFSRGISFLLSYTISKDLTDADGFGGGVFLGGAQQDYYNLRTEKAVTSQDVPQAFVAAYTYDLPFGENKAIKTGNKTINKYLLDGWITSGIVTTQSGPPLAITTELALPGIGGIRPNRVSNQYFINNDRSSFDPNKDQYLNPAAFTAPPPYSFGDAPPRVAQARAFGIRTWDVALQKSIPFTERVRLGLKAEFFNVLNITNLGAPVTDINSPSFGYIFSAGPARTGQVSATIFW